MTRQQIRDGYVHDVDLGAALEPGEIGRLIAENRHNEGLRAVLQLLRNNAAQNAGAAHDMIAASRVECGHLNVGGAQALLEVFWQVVGACSAGAAMGEESDGAD